MIKQLDMVLLLSTEGVKYMHAPANANISPHGVWIVAGFVGRDALLTKEGATIRAPLGSIKKVAEHNVPHMEKNDGKREE